MGSIRNLKKDINNVLGDIIEAVYIVEATDGRKETKEGTVLIDSAIETFDELIREVNRKDVPNRKKHLKAVRQKLEERSEALRKKLNILE